MVTSIGTPLATKPKLDVDLSGEPVDQSDYRSKIGSLMYLTSSRPDLVQAVCYCARYQARPTQKHLKEGYKFLGETLVSWMSKKTNCTANVFSRGKTEYQLADMFTKALPEDRFKYLVRRIVRFVYDIYEVKCYGILQFSFQNKTDKDFANAAGGRYLPLVGLPLSNLYDSILLQRFGKHAVGFFSKEIGGSSPTSAARVTHLAPPAEQLEDVPPKTCDMVVAEIPCRKVLDDKEKKKRKAEEKAKAKAPVVNIQAEAVVNKGVGREGPCKKRRVRAEAQAHPDSEHVSSPTPLNHAKPLEALANEEHVSPPLSVGGQGNADASPVIEGHGDNEGDLSDLQTRPNLTHHTGRRLDDVEEPAPENIAITLDVLATFPLLPNGGSRIQAAWIIPNTLIRFEALKEQHANLAYAHESCKDVKAHYKECKKELAAVQSAYDEKDRLEELEEEKKEADQLNSSQADRIKQLEEALKQSEADDHQLRTKKERYAVKAGKGEMVRQQIINQYLSTFVRRLHQSAEYKRSLGEVFSLAVGKGFIDGISIGRKDADIQAILKATPNVDPASSDTFMDAYEKLFDRRYPYVDKVAPCTSWIPVVFRTLCQMRLDLHRAEAPVILQQLPLPR
ncbi:hypothetical protein Tco_0313117 [Tanacetum coccineum]